MPARRPPFRRPPSMPAVLAVAAAISISLAAGLPFFVPAHGGAAGAAVLAPLADGFDFPVGKPDAAGYYRARGFWPGVHPGEDWNGRGGGNTDLGDPVLSIADGVVVASDDFRKGWGNCVIVRHAYRDRGGRIRMVDSQYAHLDRRFVRNHQVVRRGQQLGTIGTNRGMYYAHLHFEMRKNLQIGMNRSQFPRDYENYYNPSSFIQSHRRLASSTRRYPVPVSTFAAYGEKEIPTPPSKPPGSVVPVRQTPLPTAPAGTLEPELEEILENTPTETQEDEAELSGFWDRLRDKLKSGSDDTDDGRPRAGKRR